jgi:hypothetical protein
VYPRSITGAPQVMPDELQEMVLRWDLSWGFKMRGEDRLSDVSMQDHGCSRSHWCCAPAVPLSARNAVALDALMCAGVAVCVCRTGDDCCTQAGRTCDNRLIIMLACVHLSLHLCRARPWQTRPS